MPWYILCNISNTKYLFTRAFPRPFHLPWTFRHQSSTLTPDFWNRPAVHPGKEYTEDFPIVRRHWDKRGYFTNESLQTRGGQATSFMINDLYLIVINMKNRKYSKKGLCSKLTLSMLCLIYSYNSCHLTSFIVLFLYHRTLCAPLRWFSDMSEASQL